MSKQLDDLFRKQLEGHQATPSANAWEKLDRQLKEKKRKKAIYWMGVAASITLVLVSVWVLSDADWANTPNTLAIVETETGDSSNVAAHQAEKETSLKEEVKAVVEEGSFSQEKEERQEAVVKEQLEESKQESLEIAEIKSQGSQSGELQKEKEGRQVTITDKETVVMVNQGELEEETLLAEAEVGQEVITNEKEEVPVQKSSVKLVYTLEPVQNTNTAKQEDTPQKRSKGDVFNKITAFAKNVKVPEDGISQLRSMKNSLLSFDKEKDKK